ncbi:DUF4331 domain-containing protein [Pseudoflavitalea sp. X16]|uniref:DUF4331 family protein n=1 Tax=Paraflavitalea devenefica TaxID=2716334 RepID=UPI001421DDB9|nr:DUF4331 family protein [Paraflavitalea devenefica]NII26859.1 DUF4331 domain-containing protein [Paraflavitalea devenefica]
MKRKQIFLSLAATGLITGGLLFAADHIDSPAVTNQTTDITDVYVFRGQDPNNLVFVANTQGLLMGSAATSAARFDENTLIEFNIDNNNDNVEDLVIQGIYANGKMKIYGPVKPAETGTRSRLQGNSTAEVAVTAYGAASPTITTTTSGLKVFAGPRDDPFFFDLTQFKKIIAGQATSFNNPGTDAFAGTNVLSLVVEVPKSMLGASSGKLNVWLETKKKS